MVEMLLLRLWVQVAAAVQVVRMAQVARVV
jgi:hypothetical protein